MIRFNLNHKITISFAIAIMVVLSITNCKREDPYEEFESMSPDVWAPQSLTIADISITEKTLVWVYQITNIEGFRLDRKTGDGSWEVGYRYFPKELRIWNDDNILPNTSLTYHYQIYAFAGDYYSGYDQSSSPVVFPPPAMVTTEKITEKKYKISWMDMTTGEQGFKIDHKIDDGDWDIAYGIVPANQTSFIDTNVFRSANIQYRVFGFYESYNSEKIAISTNAALTPPTDLQITQNSISSVSLQWQDNSDGEDDFWIERKQFGEDWEHFASVKENTYIDASFNLVSQVYYRVSAHAGQYNSSYTESSFNATIPSPSNFQIVINSLTSVTLSWQDNSTGEDGFRIERKYQNGDWEQLATTTNHNFVDDNFELEKLIYYRIHTYFGEYNSAYVENNFDSSVPPPTNLQLNQTSITSVSLSWDHEITGEEGFMVERSHQSGNWELLTTTTNNNFEDQSFELKKYIFYRVSAYFNEYNSTYAEDNFYSNIPAPQNLDVTVNSLSSITLLWEYNHSGHEGFKIDRKINEGSWQNEFATIGVNQTAFTDDGLDLETNDYTYRIYVYIQSHNSQKVQITVDGWCGIPITDFRDNNQYETVKIGNQCWMAENLAYLPSVNPSNQGSFTSSFYYVYGYQGTNVSEAKATANYQNYGALYNSKAGYTACPDGWHWPTDDEWKILEGAVDSQFGIGSNVWNTTGYRGYDAEKNLKTTTGWDSGNGADLYGFSALPGGHKNSYGQFSGQGEYAFWWTATSSQSERWNRTLRSIEDRINRWDDNKAAGKSIRCLKDN